MQKYRRRTPASRFAQAEREAGIPDREPDRRTTWWLDLRPVGGAWWRCEPRIGYVSYRVYSEPAGERVMCGTPKTILAKASAKLPQTLSLRAADG